MSLAFQCIPGVSNKHNLENSTLSDKREKVKKKQPDFLSALMSTLKRRNFMSHVFDMLFGEQ